ncbi:MULTISPECIES: lysophospholipid acyltransferase family protein [unclassified Shimia]|uniref:lysophospholipid acyltransferase family protein n=1 Tax=unclassified Shimia TaxID=2630038 RepID=UPI001AD95E02|nr:MULTISPECIES: lysophospholipid acyltransferase family protein [unclassified Shimia]MBO9396867.1 lysophospholipid acyltransferase family protein [Shimia sp. R9_2]MBO9401685.1 lysophospholipid acyltransferase family protein [Shimia sp. R9_3]
MLARPVKYIWQHLRYIPLWTALTSSKWRRYDKRARSLGNMIGWVMRWIPIARRRFDREVLRIYPDMPRAERLALSRKMGQNMGRTLFEVFHNTEFQAGQEHFHISGPGLEILEKARAEGKGAILVSGHFGQWEAVRAVLKHRGMETAGVYRRQSNRHYQRLLSRGIEQGGRPALTTGPNGTKAMVRHLRAGGFVAILLDEKTVDGEMMPFLGFDALTSLAAARLALKYDVPFMPVFGTRRDNSSDIDVEFEAPIEPSDPRTMTQAFNDNLSARILEKPDQWYWLLRRWKDMRR